MTSAVRTVLPAYGAVKARHQQAGRSAAALDYLVGATADEFKGQVSRVEHIATRRSIPICRFWECSSIAATNWAA